MFIDKSSRRAAVATVLLVATSLTACATSRTAPANAETHTQPVAVTVTPTPKMEQYVVISASMSNRAYTDATMHPYRIQPGDTYESRDNEYIMNWNNGHFTPPRR